MSYRNTNTNDQIEKPQSCDAIVAHSSHSVSGAVDGLLQQGHGDVAATLSAALCGTGGGVANAARPAGEDDGVARGAIANADNEHGFAACGVAFGLASSCACACACTCDCGCGCDCDAPSSPFSLPLPEL